MHGAESGAAATGRAKLGVRTRVADSGAWCACLRYAQADRYRELLLKQRDIMTALTGRLNERDEQLLRLQEELEAYDSHQKCARALTRHHKQSK